jgi:putative ABC transport system substrate-binding protein
MRIKMKRRMLISLIGGLAIALPLACYAQQPLAPPKRVGLISTADTPCPLPSDHPIRRRLAELGWIAEQNIVFDCVSTVGRIDQGPAIARELVSRRPDVLMADVYFYVSALMQETATIPIVMLNVWEPVRLSLITSFARPGGNVTGVAWFALRPKQMEVLKEIVPSLRRVAFIYDADPIPSPISEVRKIVTEENAFAASTLGFTWQYVGATVASDYDEIFARFATEHVDAALIPDTVLNMENRTRICQLALRYRIPAVSGDSEWARAGLLLTYGQDPSWGYTRAMDYVDKILRGAKPSDLPVEQATKLDLVINLKTAKALGLTVPPALITRADEVIE